MVDTYTSSKMTVPSGLINGYNNVGLRSVGMHGTLPTTSNPTSFQPDDFSGAIYRDGPYSLLHPNNTTDERAVNLDFIA